MLARQVAPRHLSHIVRRGPCPSPAVAVSLAPRSAGSDCTQGATAVPSERLSRVIVCSCGSPQGSVAVMGGSLRELCLLDRYEGEPHLLDGGFHHRRLWCTRGGLSGRRATKFVATDRKTDQWGRRGLMTSASSDARLNEQHPVLTDLMRPQVGVVSTASDHLTVDRTSLMARPDQLTLVARAANCFVKMTAPELIPRYSRPAAHFRFVFSQGTQPMSTDFRAAPGWNPEFAAHTESNRDKDSDDARCLNQLSTRDCGPGGSICSPLIRCAAAVSPRRPDVHHSR
jgi:hypothetical protein